MSEADNAAPKPPPIAVGMIADADQAVLLAPLLSQEPFALVARAGPREAAGASTVKWYDDTRVMIAQGGIQALVLATSVRMSVELAETAAENNVHVWRLPPLARNFAGATEVARCAQRKGLVYRVASWSDFIAAELHAALSAAAEFSPHLTDIHCCAPGPPMQAWQASKTESAGGVLAHDAYDMLEALVAVRGLPDSVFGTTNRVRRRAAESLRETEDTAVAVLRYADGGLAVLRATWDTPPYDQKTVHYAHEAKVAFSRAAVEVRDAAGTLLDEGPLPDDFLRAEITAFGAAVRQAAPDPAWTKTLDRHLAVSAVLEAIYLSSRTGQPESPHKFYEVQGWPEPKP